MYQMAAIIHFFAEILLRLFALLQGSDSTGVDEASVAVRYEPVNVLNRLEVLRMAIIRGPPSVANS